MNNIIRLKKTLLSLILVFILTFSLLPTSVKGANGDSLLIGGVDIITKTEHKIEYSNGGYAKYDIATKTLELNNADIVCGTNIAAGISGTVSGSLSINVKGSNRIYYYGSGPESTSGINVQTPELNINGTDSSTSFLLIDRYDSRGSFLGINSSQGTINLKNIGCSINFNKNTMFSGGSYGINTNGNDLNISNSKLNFSNLKTGLNLASSKATINNSTLKFNDVNHNIWGVDSSLLLKDSLLNHESNKPSADIFRVDNPSKFDVNVNNSTINALGSSLRVGFNVTDLNINNGSKINLKCRKECITADKVSIIDSAIKVETFESSASAIASSGLIDIKDSTIDASSKDMGAIMVQNSIIAGDPTPTSIILNSNLAIEDDLKLVNNGNSTDVVYFSSFIPNTEKELARAAVNASNVVKIYIKDADYSTVIAAINSMPNDLTIYTETSVNRLVDAITAVGIGKNKTEQTLVDQYAKDILAAIGNLELLTVAPTIIDGNNQTITEGSEGIFRSNANINDFIKVSVDGKDLDSTNYTATSGSTIIKLNKNYIATLSEGNHKISIVSKNGTATANFTIKKSSKPKAPSTGITNDSYMLLSIMLLSGVIIIKQLKEN
ncbi:MAG: hypothetical protein RR516_02060 [Erysipelotrichaceae bacterium]